MAEPLEPEPVLGLCSCITGRAEFLPRAEEELIREFGPVALRSEPFRFDASRYYEDEMGPGLQRHWYCFRELWRAELLPRYRAVTGGIEARLAEAGQRRVNLDPGYLDAGKLVLASRKEAPAKIYLGRGVWAHTCLRYEDGAFHAPDHSFPDFRDGRFDRFMLEARKLRRALLRGSPPPSRLTSSGGR